MSQTVRAHGGLCTLPGLRALGKGDLRLHSLALLLAAAFMATGCQRESAPASDQGVARPAEVPEPVPESAPELKDIIETSDRYIIGVSYPPVINQHPGLAQAVHAHTGREREELMEAVSALGNDKPAAPFELSLSYEVVASTPTLLAVAADGSRYTGGAHGEPLVERFVWLLQKQAMLQAEALVPSVSGWTAIGNYVREQLHTAVSVRAEADEMPPAERLRFVREADRMIDEGTEPEVENFRRFQPIVNGAGRITALRFVFPPYQVGPYADGTQSVDVPTSILLPHIAPEFAELFATP